MNTLILRITARSVKTLPAGVKLVRETERLATWAGGKLTIGEMARLGELRGK